MLFNEFVNRSGIARPDEATRMKVAKDILENGSDADIKALESDWFNIWGRDAQVPLYFSEDFTTFSFIAGRGAGKTRTANEIIRYLIFNLHKDEAIRIGVITPITLDIQRVMTQGDSGLLTIMTDYERSKCKYNINSAKIEFENGSIITYFSAQEADRLRGSQFMYFFADEVAGWEQHKIEPIFAQIDFCLRLNPPGLYKGKPRSAKKFITTTPIPTPFLRKLYKRAEYDDDIIIANGSTLDNAANLNETLFKEITKHIGTKWGDQEIFGKLLMENDEGIIQRSWINLHPHSEPLPKLKYVFCSYDPAASEKQSNDPSAMVALGVFTDRDGDNSLIVLDCWTDHLAYPDLRAQIICDWEKYYGDTPVNRKKPIAIIMENKSNGSAILTDLGRTNIKMLKYSPGRGDDKHTRLNAVSHLIKDGRLYIPESKKNPGKVHPMFNELMEQLCDFPLVEHDDLVDALSQALIIFMRQSLLIGQFADREDEVEEDEVEERSYSVKKSNPYMDL